MSDTPRKRTWNVYYGDREFARLMHDPLLGTVEADTREEAERIGQRCLPMAGGGCWVVEAEEQTA